MINKEVITQEAKQSLHTYFKDNEMKMENREMLDSQKISNLVKEAIVQEKEKKESLEVLRKNIEVKAEDAYAKTFGQEQETLLPKQKLDVEQMEVTLQQEKERQMKIASELKNSHM